MNSVKGWHIIVAALLISISIITGSSIRAFAAYLVLGGDCKEDTVEQPKTGINT